MVSPIYFLGLFISSVICTKDVYVFNGINQYEWENPHQLMYDYKGLFIPIVEDVISTAQSSWTWSEAVNITVLQSSISANSVYDKKPVAGEATQGILQGNETHQEEFIGSMGLTTYSLESAIASQVVNKPYIMPCFDSTILNDLDMSGYDKNSVYSQTVRLGTPPGFVANATLAFLEAYNVDNQVERMGIAIFREPYYGNGPISNAIKSKIKASYSTWTISEYMFESGTLSGVTTANKYFFSDSKSKLESLTSKVYIASNSARVFVVMGSAEFIRYISLALEDALNSQNENNLSYNEWMILAIPSTLYPLPSYKSEELMSIKLEQWDASRDVDAKKAYQSIFVLTDDVSATNYDDMSNFVINNFNDSYAGSAFNFTWTPNRKVPSWAGYYKDAMLMYLYLLNQFPNASPTDYVSLLKGKTLTATDFGGIEPYLSSIKIDQYGDRVWKLNFHHFDSNQQWEKIATYGQSSGYTFVKTIAQIAWPNSDVRPPLYMPECNEYGECVPLLTDSAKKLLYIMVVVFAFIIIAVPAFVWCYNKNQYELELNNMGWRIGAEELLPTNVNLQADSTEDGSVKSVAGEVVAENVLKAKSVASFDSLMIGEGKKAMFSNTVVALKPVLSKHFGMITRDLMIEMKKLREMRDEYIVSVIGLCIDIDCCWMVMEDCSKGTLEEVLEDETTELDSNFKLNMIEDIAKGMYYIQSKIPSHGYLKTSNVLVSKHFTMKVGDFGESVFLSDMNRIHRLPELEKNQRLLWRAPELLRMKKIPQNGTKAGDVYSFAVIVHEIIDRQGPFNLNSIDNEESATSIVLKLKNCTEEPYRPSFTDSLKYKPLLQCRSLCIKSWKENPAARPNFKAIVSNMKRIKPGKSTGTFLDSAVKRLEKYSVTVEKAAVEKEKLALSEQKKVDDIMECFVPKSILKKIDQFEPQTVLDCTVGVIELTGGSKSILIKEIREVVAMETAFNAIVDKKKAHFEKVEMGSTTKVVLISRLTNERSPHHKALVKVVQKILHTMEQELADKNMKNVMAVKAGMHTGVIKTGLIGVKSGSVQRFGIMGPALDMAESLCNVCESFEILVSPKTHDAIQEACDDDKMVFDFGEKVTYEAGQPLEAFCLKCKELAH